MADLAFIEDRVLEIDGTQLSFGFLHGDPGDRLLLMKEPSLVERTRQLVEDLAPRRVLEVGIFQGGSTALLASLARPERLVAIDLDERPLRGLVQHLERTGLSDVVEIHRGVDQADRARVDAILDAAFGAELLDLVIDDASHLYEPTRATFETVFPRVRPGGTYVIEDWGGGHAVGDLLRARLGEGGGGGTTADDEALQAAVDAQMASGGRVEPLTRLGVELLLARASKGDVFRSVTFDADWLVVVRGEEPLPPGHLDLGAHVHDHDGFLAPRG